MVELSIIIVNYNGASYLSQCLNSIVKQCNDINYEVIIVDNNSSDNSVSNIKKEFSWVNLIENKDNVGFSKGNNIGVTHSKGSYILLLNNDTILKSKIQFALDVCSQEDIGVVGIKMLGKNNEYRYSVGHFPSPLSLLKLTKLLNKKDEFEKGVFTSNSFDVDWIEGSFLLTKRSVWNLARGMDESYFMYVEDIDFCKKVRTNNFRVVFVPSMEYVHFGGYGKSREELLRKGFKIYINKFFSEPTKTLALLSVLINFTFKKVKKVFN